MNGGIRAPHVLSAVRETLGVLLSSPLRSRRRSAWFLTSRHEWIFYDRPRRSDRR
jgi:hypothetical protein